MPESSSTAFNHPALAKLEHAVAITSSIHIARTQNAVFDFVTTAAYWHRWHPATRSVDSLPERPLVVGETIHEHISAAWRKFDATWTVLECKPFHTWVIATDTAFGASRITYRVAPVEDGCEFHRTLEYRSRRWPWTALDATLTKRKIEQQSREALRNLQRVLQTG
jgi:hypothetical protein